jgi:hypothetical protein
VPKYAPLTNYLKAMPRDKWSATFGEIERLLKFNLPPSAHRHDAWWGNSRCGNHSQAKAWLDAGWTVVAVDRAARRVDLARSIDASAHDAAMIRDLWTRAARLSGITDRGALEREVLAAFIRLETGRRLLEMGGSLPDLPATGPAPR